jgi:ABC-type uncharacterized transport system involved in gliding motility auxiliary subunit
LSKTFSGFLSVTGLLVLFFLINALAKPFLGGWFADFSEENLYSLSSGSEKILEGLEEPVTLKYFFSKTDAASIPALNVYSDRVLALLRQYDKVAGDKINFEILDPRPDSEDAEWANRFGLRPLALPSGEQIYFGLVGISSDGTERVIPNIDIDNQDQLEYDVSGLIQSLASNSRPRVGLISSLSLNGSKVPDPQTGGAQPSWVAFEQLASFSEIVTIGEEANEISPGLDALVLLHPKQLSEGLLYSIDQFVMGGGRLLVFVDPYCQLDAPPPTHPQGEPWSNSSDLNSLTGNWGAELVREFAVADYSRTTSVQTSRTGGPEEFIMWLSLGNDDLSSNEVISSGLELMVLPWAGHIETTQLEGVEITPIVESSGSGNLVPLADLQGPQGRPDSLLKKYSQLDGDKRVLAARIEGKLKSNFEEPPAAMAGQQSVNHLSVSENRSNVMIVADVDFMADAYSVVIQNSPFGGRVAAKLNDNLPFFLNAVENMSGSNELISIRSRGKVARPFTLVQKIEKDAQVRWKREEEVFLARLNDTNMRLSSFEKQGADEQVFSSALLQELENLRREKAEAQSNLRKVRRNLREDVETLGSNLFLINTFLVPVLLLIIYFGYMMISRTTES